MRRPNRPVMPALLTLLLTVFDQITKAAAAAALAEGPVTVIPGVFELYYLENHGAAFGMMQNRQPVFICLTAVFLVGAGYILAKVPLNRRMLPLRVICSVLAAGAIGNLIDRIALGYVRDFLYFSLIDFPVFNVADICVTAAAAALFVFILFYYRDEDFEFLKRRRSHAGDPDDRRR